MVRLFRVLIAFLVIFSTSAIALDQMRFLVLTDIHFDPFITCYSHTARPCPLIKKLQAAPVNEWEQILTADDQTAPAYRQDTNYPLLRMSLSAAHHAAIEQHVQFVLMLGDFLGHHYRREYQIYSQDKSRAGYQIFVNKTLTFLNNEIANAFPTLDVYSLVGNNDSYRGDYVSEPQGAFYRETSDLWSKLIKNSDNRAIMQREFPLAGYYAVTLPTQNNMRLIMMNTILFSKKASGNNINQTANQELSWLHDQLRLAKEKNQRVLIAMHIPAGVDLYASLRIRFFTTVSFWKPEYQQRFQQELQQFSSTIVGIYAGHLHADWYQVLRFDNFDEIPMIGTPSISPIFGNDPGFKVYSYSMATRQIDDVILYRYPLYHHRPLAISPFVH